LSSEEKQGLEEFARKSGLEKVQIQWV
jgi:hypothetical protein